ncbi:MAG TPA: sigma-54-dependent Fis family transcriptional regulator, partial [Nitrospiraceae bacterium]|nr:sigma-54-dependent Fis family transcriptional regulator [Nitrospiraceae bacterium]
MVELELENLALRNKVQTEGMEGILGNSPAMEKVFQTIRKIATVDVPVLILGESGTGKELTARAIHQLSNRRDRPFVVINCGAIPETLLESELFGYEKGAFTGANTRRKGRFEYAEGGTLFLDEIGELSITLQVKILRFLQEHIIERIGGRETIPLDVRVVAATNKDLKRGVDEGQFREDLYFRLSVVTVSLPSLHERGDDIFLLSQAFLRRYCGEFERDIKGFLNDAIISLSEYNWPGNVRELENRIKRAVVMAEGEMITSKDLDFVSSIPQEGLTMSLKEAKDRLEKEL